MKIAACADLHLGAGSDYGSAPGARLADQERVWVGVCRDAVEAGVSLFLFCGDAFHRRRPSPAELLAFQAGLAELRHGGVPVLILAGNHDVSGVDEPSAVEVFRGRGVRVSRRPEVFNFDLGFGVASLPWAPPTLFQAGASDPEEARKAIADELVAVARRLRAQGGDAPMILAGHWSVSSARTPSGELADLFAEPVIPRDELAGCGFDMVVLGHIHAPEVLHEHPPVFYCGAPTVVNFGESDAAHGYWMIDWERRDRWYVPTRDRPFQTYTYDVRGGRADEALFGSELPHDPTGAVVRVRILADAAQAAGIDVGAVRRRFYAGGAARVWQVTVDAERQPLPASLGGVDEQTSPLVALNAYLEQTDCVAAVRSEAVALAEEFLREGDDADAA